MSAVDTTGMNSSDLTARSERLKTERRNLPVYRARQSLLQRLSQLRGSTAVIIGETGSGKTTQIPCLLYTSPSPRDRQKSRMPSSA